MRGPKLQLTYIGGPTLLLEMDGLRLVTDPTFDPAGSVFRAPTYELRKTQGPAVSVDELGRIDVVLLSHDHHYDNLDITGRELLGRAGQVLTTTAGAARLGGNARGLGHWESIEVPISGKGCSP
jgi:L-ascorbate metabolism protein UlaG (beta-lactamase superfamily)